jgi:hypothetical protein
MLSMVHVLVRYQFIHTLVTKCIVISGNIHSDWMDFAQLPDAKECMVLVKFELWNLINATSCERRNLHCMDIFADDQSKSKNRIDLFPFEF